jgi:hypothetical protein
MTGCRNEAIHSYPDYWLLSPMLYQAVNWRPHHPRLRLYRPSLAPTMPLALDWTLALSCNTRTDSDIFPSPEYHSFDRTPLLCSMKCASCGYTLAAIENGNRCFCAHGHVDGAPHVSPFKCNKTARALRRNNVAECIECKYILGRLHWKKRRRRTFIPGSIYDLTDTQYLIFNKVKLGRCIHYYFVDGVCI